MSETNPKIETVTQQLEYIATEICDSYCKFPALYECEYAELDEEAREEKRYQEKCSRCPLRWL